MKVPEVKRIVTSLNNYVINKKVKNINPISGRYTKTPIVGLADFNYWAPKGGFIFKEISCKGKFIYFHLRDEQNKLSYWVFCTLGMTGSFKKMLNKYARVEFEIEEYLPIYFSDMRNFGTLKIVKTEAELNKKLKELGPDMLSNPCSYEDWLKICRKNPNKTLVSFLMDQKKVSGVGNIYKCESLFLAKLNPARLISDCTDEQLKNLYESVIRVLNSAYQYGGSSIKDYSDIDSKEGQYAQFPSKPEDMLKARFGIMVYGRTTDPFGNKIEKINLNDERTTWWSPSLQT